MISSSRGSNEIHLSATRDCSEMNFLGMPQPASTTLFRSPLTQVFCDPSVYTAAISTPVNLRNNDPDEPKPGDDRQTKEQIKESGHRSTPSVEEIEQCRCRQDIDGKTDQISAGLPKSVKTRGIGMP